MEYYFFNKIGVLSLNCAEIERAPENPYSYQLDINDQWIIHGCIPFSSSLPCGTWGGHHATQVAICKGHLSLHIGLGT